MALIHTVNGLRNELQASTTLQLPEMKPFCTELNYLLYPAGGHYMRHLECRSAVLDLDRPMIQLSARFACLPFGITLACRRWLLLIQILPVRFHTLSCSVPAQDEGWERKGRMAVDGGSFNGERTRRLISFILYLNKDWDKASGGELRVYPAHERALGWDTAHTEDVTPEGGTLVLLMSSDVEHLVRETRRERQCVVGWFREQKFERVPDRDVMSLREWPGGDVEPRFRCLR